MHKESEENSNSQVGRMIGYLAIALLLFATEMGSKITSGSSKVFFVLNHPIPVASLAGAFASVSAVLFICWVVFYRKLGAYTSFVILGIRFIGLIQELIVSHTVNIPAGFTSIVAIISVIVIYNSNEMVRKTQEKHRKEFEDFTYSIIGAFANCIDGKDSYTNGHSFRVAQYTRLLAEKLGESKDTAEDFYNIALLHDIGKIGIPDAILTKPGKLTDEEFALMKSHAQRGYEILKDVKIHEDIAAGAHYHHERFDGKGYPEGLSGKDIPWVARIIAVADTFDAMNSTRSYRNNLPIDFIVSEIERCSGSQFDPVVVNAFLDLYKEGAFAKVNVESEKSC